MKMTKLLLYKALKAWMELRNYYIKEARQKKKKERKNIHYGYKYIMLRKRLN